MPPLLAPLWRVLMLDSDRSMFASMLTAVAGIYGREVTPQTVAIYWNALQGYDLAAVRQAFDRHVKNPDTGQFMPKPADLIRMLGGTTQDAALAAWAKVARAMRLVGSYASVTFDDPMIHAVIGDMGGWVRLCETLEDEMPFRGREFENRYRGYALRREIPPHCARLVGRTEAVNAVLGYTDAEPVLIGAIERCRQVIATATDRPPQILAGLLPEIRDAY